MKVISLSLYPSLKPHFFEYAILSHSFVFSSTNWFNFLNPCNSVSRKVLPNWKNLSPWIMALNFDPFIQCNSFQFHLNCFDSKWFVKGFIVWLSFDSVNLSLRSAATGWELFAVFWKTFEEVATWLSIDDGWIYKSVHNC